MEVKDLSAPQNMDHGAARVICLETASTTSCTFNVRMLPTFIGYYYYRRDGGAHCKSSMGLLIAHTYSHGHSGIERSTFCWISLIFSN